MLTRIRPRAVLELARADVPGPADVVNLITTERFARYRWYALLVAPALKAVGGRVLWMARHEQTLAGEQQADKLLLVRYPSHRRFLLMTLNPYYLAINVLREAGVRRFEAGFTHASHTDPELHHRKRLVGVHFRDERPLDVAREAGWELVYATRARAALSILAPLRPTDPNPLAFPRFALFAADGDLAGVVERFGAGCAAHVYVREDRREYRPSLRPAPAV